MPFELHLQLLEIVGKQPQPLVIRKNGPALGAPDLSVEQVGEGGEQRQIGDAIGELHMAIHFGRAFEQLLKYSPAQGQRDRQAYRRPKRIASANSFAEWQNAGFVDAIFDGFFRTRRDGDDLPVGVRHPSLTQPFERRIEVGEGFDGREGFAYRDDEGRGGVKAPGGFVERLAVDIRKHPHFKTVGVATQRVDHQVRTQCRTADADMQDRFDLTKGSAFDGIDQAAHAVMTFGSKAIVVRTSLATLGDMCRRPIFRRIDDITRKQRIASARIVDCECEDREFFEQPFVQVGFRKVEVN